MQTNTPQPTDGANAMVRAASGEPMWIRLNHVKADKRELFEHFIHDILRPAVERDVQAEAYDQMWDEALASPQTGYELIQSPW
jgi:hypothetical protein